MEFSSRQDSVFNRAWQFFFYNIKGAKPPLKQFNDLTENPVGQTGGRPW